MQGAFEKVVNLSRVAMESKERKFKDLYKMVKKVEFLRYAWLQIKSNQGSKTPGVDGLSKWDFLTEEDEIKLIESLSESLENGTYKPLPVRRVEIPKGPGKKGTRPLGIPALKDRIVQSATKIILEALYEPIFKDSSHGFRPKRSCQTAMADMMMVKYDWVVEGDIKGCFDNIKHSKLLDLLRKRIADEKFIQLINKFLKSGYQMGFAEEGKRVPIFVTKDGTPQGGIVSPILANIYLSEFDAFMEPKMSLLDVDNNVRKSKEYTYYDNLINKIRRAIGDNKFPLTIQLRDPKQDPSMFKRSLNTKEELMKEIEEQREIRRKYNRKTEPSICSRLDARINKLQKVLKEEKFPHIVKYDPSGEFTNKMAEKRVIKNKVEALKTISELEKERSKVVFYDQEDYWKQRSLKYVRYADDFVVLMGNYSKKDAEELKTEIAEWFGTNLGLTLSQEKTKITHSTDGFRFLGYDVYKQPSKKGVGYSPFTRIYVPDEKVKVVKEKIEKLMKVHINTPFADLIIRVNRIIAGWSNYYKICNNWNSVSSSLQHWLFWETAHWVGKKHKSKITDVLKKYWKRKYLAFGHVKARYVDEIEGKKIPMRDFRDTVFTPTLEVADAIRQGSKVVTENWHFAGINEADYKKSLAMTKAGQSPSIRIEQFAKDGDICSKCGETKEEHELVVHHTRMVKRNQKKSGKAVFNAERDIPKVLVCKSCEKLIHPTTRQIKN